MAVRETGGRGRERVRKGGTEGGRERKTERSVYLLHGVI